MENQKLKPIAQGTLNKTPFSHILIYILERKLHGTLIVKNEKDKLSIYFRDGRPAKVNSSKASKRLGEILKEQGEITSAQLRESLEEVKKSGDLHGKVLIRMGFIDTAALVAGIKEQMAIKMILGFVIENAEFEFFQGVDLLTDEMAELINLDTISLLITGVNIYGTRMNLNSLVATLKNKAFYLEDSDIIKSYGFNKKDRTLLRKLYKEPLTLEDLRVWEDVDNENIKRVLYVLILTKKLVIVSPDKIESIKETLNLKPVVSSVPPPPAKKSFPPEIMALREEIKKRATNLPSQNYYEMLGVDMDAQSSDIRTAFFRLAKKFHPDKAGKEGLEDLKDTFGYYFTNLSEAHSTLTDFDSKELYDKNLKNGIDVKSDKEQQVAETNEEKEVRLTLEASVLYQKAMVQLKHNKVDDAIVLAEKAYVNCPEDGEYRALVSYLKVLLNKEKPADVISILREETQHNPKSENIHLFFAKVLQKADKVVEAKEQYKKVVRINPRNIEAEREIRIIDMRLRNSGKHSTKGLFGMFKK